MKLSEALLTVANWLESPENQVLLEAKTDSDLEIASEVVTAAADMIRSGAEVIKCNEEDEISLTPESLEEMAAIAQAFDESGDEMLQKQASVIDEILMTLGSDKSYINNFKIAEEKKIDELKRQYKQPKETLDDLNKTSDAIKDIEKSQVYKQYRPLEAPLKTRYCPDHNGANLARTAENEWQCQLDGKTYNFELGFTDLKGNKHGGTSVQGQSTDLYSDNIGHVIFDTRANKMGG